jgi:serine phosphatase RsbU (regulator of sigma subunit)
MLQKKINPAPSWETELNATAYRYHVLICWVAVIFDPIFAISDYYISPNHFKEFFILRISTVTLIFLLSTLLSKKFKEKPAIIALIPFLSISLQNAYMYSVMNVSEIQTHTFAYITLFIGAGMFVLWSIEYSIIVVSISLIANIILFWLNSTLKLNELLINGGLLTFSVALFTIFLIQLRTSLTKKEIIARLALAESNKQLEIKSTIIEEKNKEINDSINYSKKIQQAILLPFHLEKNRIDDYFIFLKPKDIVSGDFLWYANGINAPQGSPKEDGSIIMAAADCTGHGVPGAMVSIVCNNALNKAVLEFDITDPGKILDKTRELVLESFSKSDDNVQDGMDISLLSINPTTQEIKWAGANNSLLYVENGEIKELKANKQPIGKIENPSNFTTHTLPFKKGIIFYLFTDGFADQFGGEHEKKFMYKNFKEVLLTISSLPLNQQKEELDLVFKNWKRELEQTDDICVIGIRV